MNDEKIQDSEIAGCHASPEPQATTRTKFAPVPGRSIPVDAPRGNPPWGLGPRVAAATSRMVADRRAGVVPFTAEARPLRNGGHERFGAHVSCAGVPGGPREEIETQREEVQRCSVFPHLVLLAA